MEISLKTRLGLAGMKKAGEGVRGGSYIIIRPKLQSSGCFTWYLKETGIRHHSIMSIACRLSMVSSSAAI